MSDKPAFYLLAMSTGTVEARPADAAREVDESLLAVCRKAMVQPEAIEEAGCGIRVRWSAPPGCLSCWVDDVPVNTSVMLRHDGDAHAVEALYETTKAMLAEHNRSTPTLSGLDALVYPCVVTVDLPFGSAPAHRIAHDLVRCWAEAYFGES